MWELSISHELCGAANRDKGAPQFVKHPGERRFLIIIQHGESRELYAAYDMERGRIWDIYGPPAWLIYLKLLAKGRKLKPTSGDVNQLGGNVLIDPSGVVRMHYVGSGPADRPTVESLLAAVKNGSSNGR